MFGWLHQQCTKYADFTQLNTILDYKDGENMIPKIGVALFFILSVTVAVFVSIFPNISSFFGNHLLGLSGQKTTETRRINLCSLSDISPNTQQAFSEYETSVSVKPIIGPAKVKPKNDLTAEALAALHQARALIEHGKPDKALKLFKHALALDPTHPDILTEYGEFLENTHKDIVEAEHMYCRALVLSPSHTRAMTNRKRTLPLVEEIDQNNFNNIDKKREMLSKVPDHHPGLRRMMKENYFRHIYHTAALEGNTFTLSQTRSFVETRIVISGKSIIEHNEILGMEKALNYVNSSLIHRIGSITVRDILEIHKRVLGFVDPIGAGLLRTTQVFVGEFTPPSAGEIKQLVEEFVDWLNSEEALSLHPIELAALAHYKLVYIHPFYDGNGRTSRLLMNLILMQAGYPPIIIRVQDRFEYYEHLQAANNGDVRPFIRFIARCTEMAVDEFLWSTLEGHKMSIPGLTLRHDDGRTIIVEQQEPENESKPTDVPETVT